MAMDSAQTPPPSAALSDALTFFRVLADASRLAIVQMLLLGDLRAGEIGERVQLPTNALAYHLKHLRATGVLRDRRSSADARDVYYHLDLDRLQALYAAAGDALYPGMNRLNGLNSGMAQPQPDTHNAATDVPRTLSRPLRVLFLCTHNSARSQMAEAMLRYLGGDQVESYSAGSIPTEVHPEAIATLQDMGIDASGLYPKSLDRFIGEPLDYIVTVCDRVRDICPSFPGDPAQAHWSIADPAVVEDPEQRAAAFRAVAQELLTRIRYLLLLPHPGTGERMQPRR